MVVEKVDHVAFHNVHSECTIMYRTMYFSVKYVNDQNTPFLPPARKGQEEKQDMLLFILPEYSYTITCTFALPQPFRNIFPYT